MREGSLQTHHLVESFVAGKTHTVEMIVWKKNFYVASIIDTVHGYPPFFVELYHVNPDARSAVEQEAMVRLAKRQAGPPASKRVSTRWTSYSPRRGLR